MKEISVGLIEDHQLVRQMWITLFAQDTGIVVAWEAGTFVEAKIKLAGYTPDIVLLDINLPGVSGMNALPQLLTMTPGLKIIVVSMHNLPAYPSAMIAMGATGYVTKNSEPEEMFEAIKEVMDGKVYICKEVRG